MPPELTTIAARLPLGNRPGMNASVVSVIVFQRRTANQTEPMANRVEYFVRAGERARVRDRLTFAHFRAAELDGENRLPFVERLLGDGHEFIRVGECPRPSA